MSLKRTGFADWDAIPRGRLGFSRARSVMARAGAVERTAWLKIQGPSDKGVECLDLTSFRRNPECFWRHLKKPRGIVEVKPRFDSVVSRLVDDDAVIGAQRGDTLARPAIAIAGHQPVSVQDPGDEIVVGGRSNRLCRRDADGVENVRRRAGTPRMDQVRRSSPTCRRRWRRRRSVALLLVYDRSARAAALSNWPGSRWTRAPHSRPCSLSSKR
jgi:hypothetical protein